MLVQTTIAGKTVCIDYNQQLKRAQAFVCGGSGAYVNQHWKVDTAKKTIATTMAKLGDDSLCMHAVAPAPPPAPKPPAPPPAPPVTPAACPVYHTGHGQCK